MRTLGAAFSACLLLLATAFAPITQSYTVDSTVPEAGGCPQPDRWNLSLAMPLNREWSTAIPSSGAILTVAPTGSAAQLDEIEQVITDSFGVWSGVSGTILNAAANPGAIAPLERTGIADACSNDSGTNIDGLNTICFNQPSAGFTFGVLAFTRVISANAPGVSVGSSGPAAFTGQILDADTLVRNDGQEVFATRQALSTPQGAGAFDLESILTHELGHWLGLDHSAVIRAIMFPFSPPPGQFLGNRPTPQAPDGPLADDDRTGVRSLYPDASDAVNVGTIGGRIIPANPFALAALPSPAPGQFVTGIFGSHVVAVDADTGSVIAGTLGGWSCSTANPPTAQFDGSFLIQRLPVGRNYLIYAEPLIGIATAPNFGVALSDLCGAGAACRMPAVDTNFNVRTLPALP